MTDANMSGLIGVESQNCASLKKHFDELAARPMHIVATQETALNEQDTTKIKDDFRQKGWHCDPSPCCTLNSKPIAGVATNVRAPGGAEEIQANTEEYREAKASGRLCITRCAPNTTSPMYVVNHYGMTNGSTSEANATITDKLYQAMRLELRTHPPLPTLLVGDGNATLANLPTLRLLILPRNQQQRRTHAT